MSNNAIMDTTRAALVEYPTLKNESLQNITDEIFEFGSNMRDAAKKIAARVSYVRKHADTLCDEFEGKTAAKRFETWGVQVLGLKRAQLNAFAKVGSELLFLDGTVNIIPSGDVASKATNDANEQKLIELHTLAQDFTMTQLQALAPLGKDKVEELVYDGKVEPSMTVAEIKEVVKENDPKKEFKEAAKKKREETKKEKEQKANATVLATIKLNELENGSFVVTCNGDDVTNTNLGKYIIKNVPKLVSK